MRQPKLEISGASSIQPRWSKVYRTQGTPAKHGTDEGTLYHLDHMVQRAFKRHLKAAALPAIRFHDLRHTHASLLVHAGVHPKAIQARMGHANIQTTLNTYGHLMPQAFAGVGERLDGLLYGTRTAPDTEAVAANP